MSEYQNTGSEFPASLAQTADLTVETAARITGDASLQTQVTALGGPRSTSQTSRAVSTTSNTSNGYQASSTRDSFVFCPVTTSTTATIGGPASVSLVLEKCATNSATGASWTEIDRFTNTQTITLAIVLQSVQALATSLSGFIPLGWFYRIRRDPLVGTASAGTSSNVTEVLW